MNDANAFFSAPSPHTTTKSTTKGNDAKLAEYDGIDTPVRRTAAVATARDLFGSPGGSTNVWTPHRTVAKNANANVNSNHNGSSYDASSSSIDNGIVNNDVMATMDIRKDEITTTDNRNKNDDDNNDTIMSSTENDHRKNVYDSSSSSSDNSIEEEEEEESYEEDSSSSSSCSEVNDGKTSFERALMVRRSSLRHMNNDLQSEYRQQQQQQHVYPKLEDNGGQQRKSSEPAILQQELSLDHTTNANAATANQTATMRSTDRDVNENIATADALTNAQNNTGPTSSKTAVIPTALTLPLPFIQNHNHSTTTTTNVSTTNRVTPRRMLNLPTPPRRVFTPKSSFTPLSSSTAAINSSVATGGSGTRFKVPPPLVLPPKRTITPLRKRQEVKKVWSVPVPTPVKDIANPQPQELEQSHRKAEVSYIASASTLVHHDSNEASSTKQQQQHVVSDDTDMAATTVEKVEEIPAVVSIEAPSPKLKAQQSSLEISNKTESVFPAPPIAESNSLSKKHHEEQKEDNIFCGLGADHSYPSTTDTNNNTEEHVTSCDVTTYQTYLSSVAARLENITPSIDAPPAETVVNDVGNELITTTTTAIEIEEPEKKDDVFVEIERNPPEFEQYDEKEVVIQNTILNSNDEFIHELPPSHWTEHVDPSTNQVYYYNSITGMTTWDKPIELNNSKTSIDDVVHDKDEFALKEKSKDEDGVIVAAGVDTSELVMSATHEVEPVFDAIEVDEVCNDDVKHKELSDDVIEDITEEEPKSTENEWTEHVDPSTNQVYYYNSITGMTTWDKPIELESSTTSKDDVFIPTEYLTPGNTSIENVIVEEVISNANHNVPTTTKEIHGFIPTEDEKDDAIDEKSVCCTEIHDGTVTIADHHSDTNEMDAINGTIASEAHVSVLLHEKKKEEKESASPVSSKVGKALGDIKDGVIDELPPSHWTEHVDPSTNQVYYYNSITGMTTWDKPSELDISTTLNDNVNMQEKVVVCANDVTHPYAYPQQQQPQRKHRANHGRPAHAICHIQFGYTVLMHTLPAANLALTSSSVGMTSSSVGGGRRKDRVYLHRLHTLLKKFDVLKVPHPSKSSASTTFTSAKPGAISDNSGTKGTMIQSRSTSDKSVLERIIEVAQDNAGRLRCTSATATSSQPGTISMPMHPRVYSILQHYASKPGPTNITTQSDTDNNNMAMVQYYLHNNQFTNAIQTLLDMKEYTLALLYTFAYTHSSLATSSAFGTSATENTADSGIVGEEGTVWHMCLRHIFTQDIAKRTILTNHNDDATGLQLQLQALQSICSLKYLQDIHYFTHASSSSSYVDLMTRFISKVLSHSTMDVTDNSMNALASTIAGIVYEIVRYGANVSHWEVLLRDLGDALLQTLRLVLHNRKISSLQIQQSNFNEKEESSMHSLNSLVEWAHVCYVLSGCKLDEQRLPLLYYFHYSTSTDDDDSDTVKEQQNLSAENEEGDIVNILPLLYHQSYSANVSNNLHSYNNGIGRRTPLEVVPNIQKALDTTLQWEHAKRQGNIFCALPNLVRYKCQYLLYLSELGYFSSSATFSTDMDKDVDGTYHIVEEYLRNVNDADVLKDRILVHLNLEPDAVRFYRSTKHDDMEEKEEKDKMKHLLRSTAKSILPDRISIPLSQQNQQQQQQSDKKQQQSMMMAMTPTPRTPIHLQQQQKQKQEQTSDTTTTLSSTTVVNLNANTNIHSNRKPPLNNSTSAKQLQQQSKSQNDQFVTPTPTPVKSMTTEKVEHTGANTTNNISMMGLRSSSAPNFSNTTSSNSSSTATAGTGAPKAAAAIPKAPLSTPISRASAPASATKSTSTPTTTSSSPSSNPLSNIKSWFIHKLHPNATEADVGDAMQAYYCKEQKRWIFPNEDADDANAALRNLGPPPTKTSSMNKKNADTSSSPTDISSTPVPSSSLTNHPLNETTQGKEQVDALTALMAPPSMPRTRSTKSNNNGNKRMNNNTGGTAPKFAVFAPPPVTPAASTNNKNE